MSALYLHIPFCKSKCFYCSFTSYAGKDALHLDYIETLKKEIHVLVQDYQDRASPVETIFVGGGTPTSISAELLCGLLDYTLQMLGVGANVEISVEVNPGTVDLMYLKKLRQVGVNRLSFGVQSFADRELELIGRTHKGKEAVSAVKNAQEAGFENINIDLMYGLPTQTCLTWRETLSIALGLDVVHLSLYQLSVEETTPYFRLAEKGSIDLPTESLVIGMEEVTQELCEKFNFSQYEISNFCRDSFVCKHNINYWLNNEYMAAGVGAVSYLGGVREKRVAGIEEYLALARKQQSVVVEREKLGLEESFRETVIMGLRMTAGVSRERLMKRYGIEVADHYGKTLTDLIAQGFLELTDSHLKITAQGWPLSNQLMAKLV